MQNSAVRILLVDDHPALRQGLSRFLSDKGISVLAEADTPQAASAVLASCQVDLALVDLSFEQDEGFALISSLRAKNILVLVYSMHEDSQHIRQSLNRGANGYVSKREDSEILLQSISAVLQGRQFLSPRAAKSLQDASSAAAPSRCSAREMEILGLLSQGLGNTEIAKALALSVRTVETYCTRINEKLELSGMKELRRFAVQHAKEL